MISQTLKNNLAELGLVVCGASVAIICACFAAMVVGMTLSAFGVI